MIHIFFEPFSNADDAIFYFSHFAITAVYTNTTPVYINILSVGVNAVAVYINFLGVGVNAVAVYVNIVGVGVNTVADYVKIVCVGIFSAVAVDSEDYKTFNTTNGVAPADINKWFQRHSNGHSMSIAGLVIGKIYQFAAAYKGKDADSLLWSAIVSKMVGD